MYNVVLLVINLYKFNSLIHLAFDINFYYINVSSWKWRLFSFFGNNVPVICPNDSEGATQVVSIIYKCTSKHLHQNQNIPVSDQTNRVLGAQILAIEIDSSC